MLFNSTVRQTESIQCDDVNVNMDSFTSDINNKEGDANRLHSSPVTTNDDLLLISSSEPFEAYKILNVKGPNRLKDTTTTKSRSISPFLLSFRQKFTNKIKRAAWKCHGKLIPLFHWQDWVETRFLSHLLGAKGGSTPPPPPQELFVNLRVLWNKAISSLDPRSPVYEGHLKQHESIRASSTKEFTSLSSCEPDSRSIANHSKSYWWTYRLLPPTTRWVLSIIPSFLFPRWYHANIELRTAYLNRAVDIMIDRRIRLWEDECNRQDFNKVPGKEQVQEDDQWNQKGAEIPQEGIPRPKIRLVILGAGYDTRSVRLLQQGRVDQVFEFDLPPIMESKRWLLKRRGLYDTRPIPFHRYENGTAVQHDMGENAVSDNSTTSSIKGMSSAMLEFIGLDLNQPESFRSALEQLLRGQLVSEEYHQGTEKADSSSSCSEWYTIVISEALFLYLEPSIPAKLLTICQDLLGACGSKDEDSKRSSHASTSSSSSPTVVESLAFCFADRFLEVPLAQAYDVSAVRQWFDKIGWTLVDWLPKEGATRQMGISRPK